MRLQVLGSSRAWHGGTEIDLGPPGRRAVLGLLALARGEAVTQAELVRSLWGASPPRSAVNVVQTHVKHLRRLLEPTRPHRTPSTVLPYSGGGYALAPDAVEVDLARFRHLVAEAGRARRAGEVGRVAELLGEALRLWQGPPLADVPFLAAHPWVVALVAKRAEVAAAHGDAMISTGAAADVLPDLVLAAGRHPLDEAAQARLIRAHHAVGQRARAFRVYHETRDRLADELGVDPGPELREAHTALLREGGAGSAAALRVPRQLPVDPVGFTGRAAELAVLDGIARPGAIAAVSGAAGVGKTALAVHWAHRARDRFPHGQLYADLRGHTPGPAAEPIEVLAQFLSALGVPPQRVPVDLGTASAMYRTLLTDRKMLVLLDNGAGPEQVRPLLPAGRDCLVLVTGRERMTGLVATHGARGLALDVLGAGEALALLESVLGPDPTDPTDRAATDRDPADLDPADLDRDGLPALARLCAGLPLALRIAAANIADGADRDVAGHVARLREGNPLAALSVRGDEQAAVRTAFDLSLAALPTEARGLFRLLSLLPGADFGTESVAALAGVPVDRAAALLDRLADASLVERHSQGRHRFHDLLRHFAAELAEGQQRDADDLDAARARLHDWFLRAVDRAARLLYPHMLRLPVPVDPAAPPAGPADLSSATGWLDAERGTLVALARETARSGPRPVAWLLSDSLRGYFWMSMRRVDWLATAEAGLAAAEAEGGWRARASARLSMADLHFRQGRYRQAVRHHAHALLLARNAGWVEAQAAVLGNLGCVYWQSGRLAPAAARFERALLLSTAIGQTSGEAVALGNLGLVHWEMGALERAAEHYGRALERYRAVGSRYGEAINLCNLGEVTRALGRPEEAEGVLRRALALHRETGDRSGEAESRSRLAGALSDLGRAAEAAEHAREGLVLAQEAGDPRTEAESLAALAALHHRRGRPREAADHYRQALVLIGESGDRYPEVDVLVGLASATGDTAPASRALALAEECGFHALRGLALSVLAHLALASGERGSALRHAERALAVQRGTGDRRGVARALAVVRRARSPV
ncbi:tetratricopeptide repeat protein [Actinosynnema pretiosum subsp. pretiosum]|uniref:Tetratricopeptide repeat protein n=1 Tax=Actinosynnema pretiosum subsp. pretiosum TaxID=103721 RepID=A0AA45LCF2_9PSEU|nr:tetratricopeptide repeat protein [Actinosynnema pretiosum subsp. pretiosum]